MATGAWKDRPLPIDEIDHYINKGLIYQNPFVYWFNHHHEPKYNGPKYNIKDNAVVIGGGLASLDVVKIIMLETVHESLKLKGIDIDLFTLEHGIYKVLDKHQLTLPDLGLKGCTLFYRRRAIDMPLTPLVTDTPEKLQKAQIVRKKILDNYQKKYLFRFEECCQPIDKITTSDRLTGIKFQRTIVDNGKLALSNDFFEVQSEVIISSIGSIPEKIPGIPSDGSVFRISNPQSCQIDGLDNVFAIGNAVTGRGNINESMKHSRDISESIIDDFLEWRQDDYENWHRQTAEKVDHDISQIIGAIEESELLPDHIFQNILEKTKNLQKKIGYTGSYKDWVKQHTPPRLENML
jgi:ferredoxin--NADP+ reductase